MFGKKKAYVGVFCVFWQTPGPYYVPTTTILIEEIRKIPIEPPARKPTQPKRPQRIPAK